MNTTQLQELLLTLRQELGLQVGFTQVLMAFALMMSRVLPVIILTPFLGGETVPQQVKIGLGVMLGMVLYPVIVGQVKAIPISATILIALLLKELFIGLSIAFIVNLVFEAAQSAGALIDILSGTSQAQLHVPSIGHQTTIFSALQLQMTVVLFLSLGGHHLVINALGESFVSLPLDQYPRFSHGFWPFFEVVLRTFGDLMRIAVALSSPVLLATFLVDLALGMINRVAPQVQVYFVSMQIKPVVSVLIVFFSIHLILGRILDEYGIMFGWLKKLLAMLA